MLLLRELKLLPTIFQPSPSINLSRNCFSGHSSLVNVAQEPYHSHTGKVLVSHVKSKSLSYAHRAQKVRLALM